MKPRPRRRFRPAVSLVFIAVLIVYAAWCLYRPLPKLSPVASTVPSVTLTGPSKLSWPGSGQAAVGLVGTSILETYGTQTPMPAASTAKLITVLTVLEAKPLAQGQAGPVVTLTQHDVDIYNDYVARDGSILPVQAGEQLSQYQMLQAILLPSANNIADSLAIWAYGSLDAYAAAANAYLSSHGLTQTHVGSDASGLSPDSTTTAHDLVMLGQLAMANPVIAEVASQSSADGFPLAGTIRNVNVLLGTDNIVGIKTGNSDQAGGVFAGAATTTVNGKSVTIVTAVVDQTDLYQALRNSDMLLRSAQANFTSITLVKAGATVGRYKLPWGGTVEAVAAKDMKLNAWIGSSVKSKVNLKTIATTARSNQSVGSVSLAPSALNSPMHTDVILKSAPGKPSMWWRLSHPGW